MLKLPSFFRVMGLFLGILLSSVARAGAPLDLNYEDPNLTRERFHSSMASSEASLVCDDGSLGECFQINQNIMAAQSSEEHEVMMASRSFAEDFHHANNDPLILPPDRLPASTTTEDNWIAP